MLLYPDPECVFFAHDMDEQKKWMGTEEGNFVILMLEKEKKSLLSF